MKTICIIQARMGSTRFPNKVMREITGVPMIGLLLERVNEAKLVDQIVVATSNSPENKSLVKYVNELGYSIYEGSEQDVLDRYYQAALLNGADNVVRITGDCPLIDSALIDEVIGRLKQAQVEYASNISPPTYPDGLDTEVFTFKALEQAWKEAKEPQQREHVTPFIRESGLFSQINIAGVADLSRNRWTVDEPEDFEVIQKVYEKFYPDHLFGWRNILNLSNDDPDVFKPNQHLIRNEGAEMCTGQKLYKRAKKVIPGGTMLLSKRPEMFLPEQWPSYFSKSKGCSVWDLDDKKYIDMSIMGIGTNILGYGHPEVDEAVIETIKNGNMSTFSCPEEVYLAEKLIEIHPWADMVRFARAGGEINSIAIRIARAATGKDKIAICGYHGWHDWYLSTNLNDDKNLDGHLLPGLEPNGVPRGLTGTTLPFNYNDIEQLEHIIESNSGQIAAIKMEVSRNEGPENNFLQKVRALATKNNIVLIFDECTSGFRETFGGLHKKFGVEPDIAIFAKALGNGYAISACIGRKEFMQAAQNTFISSTFWTERIGPTAALKTLEIMEREKSWEKITHTGKNIGERWKTLAQKYELPLDINGLPALIGFSFRLQNMLKYKTLITQEMLKKGILAATSVYVCTEHKQPVIDKYFDALDPIFALIKECEQGRSIDDLLEGPVCHSGFKRLN
jgi:glutamate-1-semialdehyde 2,1-aminomutase